jgi:hypothetical protein
MDVHRFSRLWLVRYQGRERERERERERKEDVIVTRMMESIVGIG